LTVEPALLVVGLMLIVPADVAPPPPPPPPLPPPLP
jgi:hypothetical protein